MSEHLPEDGIERYFQLVAERKISEAEKELEEIRGKIPNSEWCRGYLKALEGLFLTKKANNDKYLYLARVDPDEKTVRKLRREFVQHSANPLHAQYDRGYFRALADYTKVLSRLEPVAVQEPEPKKD